MRKKWEKNDEMESYYKAKHTYSPENTDELSFKKGMSKKGENLLFFLEKSFINSRRFHQTGEKSWWCMVGRRTNKKGCYFIEGLVSLELRPRVEAIRDWQTQKRKGLGVSRNQLYHIIIKKSSQKAENVTRQSRILNDQKFRAVVLEEILQNTAKFLAEVDHIITKIYPEIKSDHQAYFNFKKLVQSLVGISTVEKSIVSAIQSTENEVKMGSILLEVRHRFRTF